MSASQSSISILYAAAILEFQGDEPGGHFCAVQNSDVAS